MASYEFDVTYVLSKCREQETKCTKTTVANLKVYYESNLEYYNGWYTFWNKFPFVNIPLLTIEDTKKKLSSECDIGYDLIKYRYLPIYAHCRRLVDMCEEIMKNPQYQHGSKINLTESDFRIMTQEIN